MMIMQDRLLGMAFVLCCAMLAGDKNSSEPGNFVSWDEVVARMDEVELRASDVSKLIDAQSREVKL